MIEDLDGNLSDSMLGDFGKDSISNLVKDDIRKACQSVSRECSDRNAKQQVHLTFQVRKCVHGPTENQGYGEICQFGQDQADHRHHDPSLEVFAFHRPEKRQQQRTGLPQVPVFPMRRGHRRCVGFSFHQC